MTRKIYWSSERLDQFQKQNAFLTAGFPDLIHQNNENLNWKRKRNWDLETHLQEKLEKVQS